MSEDVLYDKINMLLEKKKELPRPEDDFYIKNNICPICLEKTEKEKDMLHPNDGRSKLLIHERCWNFIRESWVCRACKRYFPKNIEGYRLPEFGKRCKDCFIKLQNELRQNKN